MDQSCSEREARDSLRASHFSIRRLPFSIFALTALWLSTASSHAADPGFFRGVTISAQTWGREWQTPEMAAAMDELKSLGANAIAIHPYARIQIDGSLKFPSDPAPGYITKPLDWAREKNLRIMLIPHIAYWGTPFLWRGEINFA